MLRLIYLLLLVGTVAYGADTLQPVEYETEYLPNKTPEPWYCLTDAGLTKCKVSLETTLKDACGMRMRMSQVTTSAQGTKFLFRGVEGLVAGKIDPVRYQPSQDLFKDASVEITQGSAKYVLTTKKVGEGSFAVTLTAGEKTHTIETKHKKLDDDTPKLLWAGDINGDGVPDLILDMYAKYSVEAYELFLSQPGFRWQGVAHQIRATAC